MTASPVDAPVAPTSGPAVAVAAGVRRCGCGAPVRRVATRSGSVVLEADSCADGNVVPERGEGGLVVALVLTEQAAALYAGPRWRPHLPQCPDAVPAVPDRCRPGGLELSNVRCPGCQRQLPVVLLRLAEDCHPGC